MPVHGVGNEELERDAALAGGIYQELGLEIGVKTFGDFPETLQLLFEFRGAEFLDFGKELRGEVEGLEGDGGMVTAEDEFDFAVVHAHSGYVEAGAKFVLHGARPGDEEAGYGRGVGGDGFLRPGKPGGACGCDEHDAAGRGGDFVVGDGQ